MEKQLLLTMAFNFTSLRFKVRKYSLYRRNLVSFSLWFVRHPSVTVTHPEEEKSRTEQQSFQQDLEG